jgi:hypothetical protein
VKMYVDRALKESILICFWLSCRRRKLNKN